MCRELKTGWNRGRFNSLTTFLRPVIEKNDWWGGSNMPRNDTPPLGILYSCCHSSGSSSISPNFHARFLLISYLSDESIRSISTLYCFSNRFESCYKVKCLLVVQRPSLINTYQTVNIQTCGLKLPYMYPMFYDTYILLSLCSVADFKTWPRHFPTSSIFPN
jgi:hypothetical protein